MQECLRSKHSPDTVIATWHSSSGSDASLVLPDGCCDLIFSCSGQGVSANLTNVDAAAYLVASVPSVKMLGFRFHPGVQIDRVRLNKAAEKARDASEVFAFIEEHSKFDPNLSDALASLTQAQSVPNAAKANGVSLRQFQRLVGAGTGKPPRFWRQLARVRRAACRLGDPAALADLAIDCGYSDQAHMAREFRRWFGQSAVQISNQGRKFQDLLCKGYGDTGEQISTK